MPATQFDTYVPTPYIGRQKADRSPIRRESDGHQESPDAEKGQGEKGSPHPAPAKARQDNIHKIGAVQLTMTAELGRTRDTIEKVMEYGPVADRA